MSERGSDLLIDLEKLALAMPRALRTAADREDWLAALLREARRVNEPGVDREEFLRARPWLSVVGPADPVAARAPARAAPGESERREEKQGS